MICVVCEAPAWLKTDFKFTRVGGTGGKPERVEPIEGPPLPIVVAVAWRIGLLVAPQVHHLVHERRRGVPRKMGPLLAKILNLVPVSTAR